MSLLKFLSKYNITKKTIVYTPGGFDIRKNFENLIKSNVKNNDFCAIYSFE